MSQGEHAEKEGRTRRRLKLALEAHFTRSFGAEMEAIRLVHDVEKGR
jgi:hypothetical protein